MLLRVLVLRAYMGASEVMIRSTKHDTHHVHVDVDSTGNAALESDPDEPPPSTTQMMMAMIKKMCCLIAPPWTPMQQRVFSLPLKQTFGNFRGITSWSGHPM